MRLRIAEIDENAVAHIFSDVAIEPSDNSGNRDAAALMTRVNATLEEWIRDDRSNGSGCTDAGRISRLSASLIGKRTPAPTSRRSERGAFVYGQWVLRVLSNPFRPCHPAA